jgi:diacylglycerol kinase
MSEQFVNAPRSWPRKFRDAFRGIWVAVSTQTSFWVHVAFVVPVVAAGWWWRIEVWQWCILVLCMGGVLVAEMLNSAMERMAKAVDREYNPHLRDALDMGSAAVLLAAMASVILGLLIFLPHVLKLVTTWL